MTARLDELLEMAVFARVVEAHSFTEAASRLGLSKSVVSKRVTNLEDRLGVRLLHRTTRRILLTEAGRTLYEGCARFVAAANAALEIAEETSNEPHGTLRVNTPVTFGQMYLARAVAVFVERYPQVHVELTAEDRLVDILQDGFDLALRISRLGDSNLIARRLAVDRLVVCASPAYLARSGVPHEPEDLLEHTCMRYTRVSGENEWRFRSKEGPFTVPTFGSFGTSDGLILREAALAGVGLAVMPSFMVAPDVAAGRLVTVLEGARRAEIGIFALHPSRRHTPAKVRAFVDFLAEWFAGDRIARIAAPAPKEELAPAAPAPRSLAAPR